MTSAPALPLALEVDVPDPLHALRALADLPHGFLLHPSLTGRGAAWTFFGADPFAFHLGGDAAAAIAAFRTLAPHGRIGDDVPGGVPFTGGAVGFWAYDYGRRLERIAPRRGRPAARDDLHLPDFALGFYDVVGAYDHGTRRAWLFSSGLPEAGAARAARAARRLDAFAARLAGLRAPADPPWGEDAHVARAAVSTFTPDAYRRAIRAVQEHIRGGDIFQANLSQRWTVALPPRRPRDRAAALFESLAARSPAPHAAFLDAGDFAIASASPERFLELSGRLVTTRPIKGTRPRGATADEDARLREQLLASAKDRAENVMIVDVLRNDLGRVCETGSVAVPQLCALEPFAQVFHLTSTVTGVLAPGHDAFDLLHACFPGGSITGAPKIRAMEILEGLEPVRRHVYTGSLGWLDWRGGADWNVAIRTALVTDDAVRFAAGGGITADSDPDAEHAETLHKAEGMRVALEACAGPLALTAGEVHAP